MICLHHNDLDGRCAAAIIYQIFPECRFREMDYRSSLPLNEIGTDERVYVVDFSLQNPGDWEKLFEKTTDVCWIDHHESAIKKAPPWLLKRNDGIVRTDRCGAWLTWEWMQNARENDPIPAVIKLVDAWDRWKHEDADEVLDFVAGMKICSQIPSSEIWEILLGEPGPMPRELLSDIQRDGQVIREYEKLDNLENVKTFGYPVGFEGHNCLVINSIRRSSLVFGSSIKDFDICIAYVHDGKKFTVSLYSETVKVNDIAMKHGGGGHPGAAGFVCEELPW